MIYNIDCMEFLKGCNKYATIFADPPDNIGLEYIGYNDCKNDYIGWLTGFIELALTKCDVLWLSYNQIWDLSLKREIRFDESHWTIKQIIWRYRFGQYNDSCEASGYRPILRFKRLGVKLNYDAIRIDSQRQQVGDKRAKGKRVPDDVWDFPRVLGVRDWHPTKHPQELMERILTLSGGPVLDCFLGSGTTLLAAKKLEIEIDGCEISKFYFEMLKFSHALS